MQQRTDDGRRYCSRPWRPGTRSSCPRPAPDPERRGLIPHPP